MICEYCGGKVIPVMKSKDWISGECENCKTRYAFRHTKEFHISTLKAIYGDQYDIKMKEYKKRKEELINGAEI